LKKGLASFDYIGFSLLSVGVGALQIVLNKGREEDWFGSDFITTLVVIAVVGPFGRSYDARGLPFGASRANIRR
jgi:hypothetical protein